MNWALTANLALVNSRHTQLLRGEEFSACGELHPSSNLNFSLSLSSSKWPSWTFHSRLHQSGLSAKTLHHPIQSRAAMQPGDNLGTFSSWSFHSGMKASFHLHLLCKSFRLLLWCMQIAAEATRLEKTKWTWKWIELVPKGLGCPLYLSEYLVHCMAIVRRKGYLYGQSLTCWWGAFTREK